MLIDYEVQCGLSLPKFFAKIPCKPNGKIMNSEEKYTVDLLKADCSNLYKVGETLYYTNNGNSGDDIKRRSLEPYFRRARWKLKPSK